MEIQCLPVCLVSHKQKAALISQKLTCSVVALAGWPGLWLCLKVPHAVASLTVLIKLSWLSQGISQLVTFTVKKALEIQIFTKAAMRQRISTQCHLPNLCDFSNQEKQQFYLLDPDILGCDSTWFFSQLPSVSDPLHVHSVIGKSYPVQLESGTKAIKWLHDVK